MPRDVVMFIKPLQHNEPIALALFFFVFLCIYLFVKNFHFLPASLFPPSDILWISYSALYLLTRLHLVLNIVLVTVYCCEETPWLRQLTEGSIELGTCLQFQGLVHYHCGWEGSSRWAGMMLWKLRSHIWSTSCRLKKGGGGREGDTQTWIFKAHSQSYTFSKVIPTPTRPFP